MGVPLTRDPGRCRTYIPAVELMFPLTIAAPSGLSTLRSHPLLRDSARNRSRGTTVSQTAPLPANSDETAIEHVDVLVVGAGISGIGAAYHLTHQSPEKSFVVLEGMDEEIGRQHDAVLAAEARIAFLEQERDQDPLTPLLNRRAILADIAQLQRLDQAEQRRSSVILVDIPGWETSMAALARERREALLDRLGQALLGAVGLNPAARIAGARFAVLAVGLTGEKALALAHDCARALARPLVGTGDLRLPEPELGLIALPREGEAEEILARAEAALRPRAGVKR